MLNVRTVNKALALVFVFVVLSSLMVLTVNPVDAQATFKPSVPEFSVKLIDNSYNIPPSTTTIIDPYTGKETIYTNHGNQITDRSIEVTIKNQPVTTYTDANNYKHEMRYIIQYKGHFEENWKDFPGPNNRFTPSDSQYTVVTAACNEMYGVNINSLAVGSQLDFRVQAVDGYLKAHTNDYGSIIGMEFIHDVTSGWSSVQTITINYRTDSGTTPTTNPTTSLPSSSPQASTYYSSTQEIVTFVPYSGIIILLCVIALTIGIIVALTVVLLLRRHPKTIN